jgi:hypothetical protein
MGTLLKLSMASTGNKTILRIDVDGTDLNTFKTLSANMTAKYKYLIT